MSERPVLTDDAIRAMLKGRAARGETAGLLASVRAAASATPQRRFGRLGLGLIRGPVTAGAAGVASLAVLLLVVSLAAGWRVPGVATASGNPSSRLPLQPSAEPPATPIVPGAVGPVLPLTVDQLNALMKIDPRLVAGRELVITGHLGRNLPVSGGCANPPCPPAVILVASSPLLGIQTTGNLGVGPWDQSPDGIFATFAATLVDARTLRFDGLVGTTASGGAVLPSELAAAARAQARASQAVGYWLVQGWIAGLLDPIPCPLTRPTPPPGPQFGCGRTAILSDTSSQPQTAQSFVVAPDAIRVQNDAYQDFAPAPGPDTRPFVSAARLSMPEEATFLVQDPGGSSCPPGVFCPYVARADGWVIVARIDPWLATDVTPTPPASEPPAPSTSPGAPVLPLTVNQLNAFMAMNSQSPADRQLVITGTIERNLPVGSCVGPSVPPCQPAVILAGSNPVLGVVPVGDIGPGPWDQGGAPVTGTFAATLNDGFVLDYQGPVRTAADGGPLLPSQLPDPAGPGDQVGFVLVQGWISGATSSVSCPQPPVSPYDGPQYTCAGFAVLSDTTFPPTPANPVFIPVDGIRVQNNAYEDFAPLPASPGSTMEAEQATFLVHAVAAPACGPNADCFIPPANYHWAIVARIGPWPLPRVP